MLHLLQRCAQCKLERGRRTGAGYWEDARKSFLQAPVLAFAHLDVRGTLHHEEIELVVYPTETGARLAWRVFVTPAEPAGDWESFVDAETGELFRVARRTLFHGHNRSERAPRPIVEAMSSGQQPMRVDATGFIHDPDPLTRADATYGDPGFTDGNDANTPQLEAARREVTLRDVTFDGSVYKLEGPYADILDWDPPLKGEFDQPEPEWSFTRDHDAFEAATVYWHIDNYMRYVDYAVSRGKRAAVLGVGLFFMAMLQTWYGLGPLRRVRRAIAHAINRRLSPMLETD